MRLREASLVAAGSLACVALGPRAPRDWDSVGFLLSLREWDPARFRPHPPGYPAYVLAARGFAAVLPTGSLDAAPLLLASALGAALLLLAFCVALPEQGPRAPLCALACFTLLERGSSVGADALGLGLFALSVALAPRAAAAAGALFALCLCARPTLALELGPALLVALALLGPKGARAALRAAPRALLGALLASAPVLLWLSAQRGSRGALEALRSHAAGHAARFGGSLLLSAEPASYLRSALRACCDAAGGEGALGALCLCALTLGALFGARVLPPRLRRACAVGLGAQALTVLLAQNATAPRHWMPLVLALSALASLALPRRALALVPLGLLVFAHAYQLRSTRREEVPGMQLARWLHERHGAQPVLVLGGPRARFAELFGYEVQAAGWMGEAELAVAQRSRGAAALYVTEEVTLRERSRGRLTLARCACEGPRCLRLFRYEPPPEGSWWAP